NAAKVETGSRSQHGEQGMGVGEEIAVREADGFGCAGRAGRGDEIGESVEIAGQGGSGRGEGLERLWERIEVEERAGERVGKQGVQRLEGEQESRVSIVQDEGEALGGRGGIEGEKGSLGFEDGEDGEDGVVRGRKEEGDGSLGREGERAQEMGELGTAGAELSIGEGQVFILNGGQGRILPGDGIDVGVQGESGQGERRPTQGGSVLGKQEWAGVQGSMGTQKGLAQEGGEGGSDALDLLSRKEAGIEGEIEKAAGWEQERREFEGKGFGAAGGREQGGRERGGEREGSRPGDIFELKREERACILAGLLPCEVALLFSD